LSGVSPMPARWLVRATGRKNVHQIAFLLSPPGVPGEGLFLLRKGPVCRFYILTL